MADHVRAVLVDFDRHLIAVRHVLDDVADVALDRRRGDAVRFVVQPLLLAPPPGLVHRALHRTRDAIGIEDHAPVDVARRAADRLDQRRFGTQEPFLVGIEDRDQPTFGNVEPLAQQVDPDQHIVNAQPQIADQLDALQRLDIAVHIADANARLVHELGKILRHTLGQRGDERAIPRLGGLLRLDDQILHLLLDRLDLDRRVDQPGRADHLFGKHPAGLLHFPRARRRRDIGRLRAHRVPLVKAQRTVVDRAWQAKAIFGQSQFPPVIAARHAVDLADRLVAFIDEQQRILGQIFEQRRRRLARHAAGEEARVILDPRATARRGDHLQIEIGALLQPLRLKQLALGDQFLQPFCQLEFDRLHRLFQRRPRRDVVRIGVDADIIEARDLFAGQRIELDDLLDIVAEERHAPRGIVIMRREDFERIAAHAEIAALERGIVTLVLQRDELAHDLALIDHLALLEVEDHRRIGLDRADTVEARYRRHDDHIIAFEQRARRRVPHPVDRFVGRAFLLDIGVAARDIGFGLIVIVIADEIFDRVIGEERLHLAVELRREDLVGRQDQRRPLHRLDHLGHGEGLARSGDAEQHLIALPRLGLRDQLGNRGRLVARGGVFRHNLERPPALGLGGPRRAVRDKALPGLGFVERGANVDGHGGNMATGPGLFQWARRGQLQCPRSSVRIAASVGKSQACHHNALGAQHRDGRFHIHQDSIPRET